MNYLLFLTMLTAIAAAAPHNTTLPLTTRAGLTMDPCSTTSSCTPPRKCYNPTPSTGSCASNSDKCWCSHPSFPRCTRAGDCPEGEVCAARDDEAKGDCFSATFVSKADLEILDENGERTKMSGNGCVAVKHLKHWKGGLVYPSNRWTKVLCDTKGNCATAGHVVVVAGKVGMWKTFCKGCVERVMQVNSPRMGWGVRVRGEGVDFTAYAARFETAVEEVGLRALVRIGA